MVVKKQKYGVLEEVLVIVVRVEVLSVFTVLKRNVGFLRREIEQKFHKNQLKKKFGMILGT